ncbi:MAG: thioredoxin domain-containing protein [Patescibacteria group bacterium]
MSSHKSYSFGNTVQFISDNFGVIFLVILFFVGGFFAGALWTENQAVKAGGSPTKEVADANQQEVVKEENKLSKTNLQNYAYATNKNFDRNKFDKCLDNSQFAEKIKNQSAQGSAAGITGTPGTIIVVDGQPKEIISGALPIAQIKTVVDRYLTGNSEVDPKAAAALKASGFAPISEDDHLQGNKEAKIVLVEYSDFECPYCSGFHNTMNQVIKEYGDQIAWVYRHYPLGFHPNAQLAAQAAECVAEVGGNEAFWRFADQAFAK